MRAGGTSSLLLLPVLLLAGGGQGPQNLSLLCEGLVVGLNLYSHDTSVCILDRQGDCLFAGQKERLTRVKHDAGDASELVQHALESAGVTLHDVSLVVVNNHHYRVAPFERRLGWSVSMGHYPRSYADPFNLFPGVTKVELSHHLAHAWGAAWQSNFEEGMVIVMDGMGEKYQDMASAFKDGDPAYFSDLSLGFFPSHSSSPSKNLFDDVHTGQREAESVYSLKREAGRLTLKPLWKRWTRERSPPELYNHGFENMESVGAVYSRLSSHIFGDWNSCGKVMGLAPWSSRWGPQAQWQPQQFMDGDLLEEDGKVGAFQINWDALDNLPSANQLSDKELRPMYACMANQVQQDLERVALPFFTGLRERFGFQNACFCGGVALNSVLNGRLSRECGFESVYIPPCPGDEGIAVGCAAFGLSLLQDGFPVVSGSAPVASAAATAVFPFTGSKWSADDIETELEEFEPWVVSRVVPNEKMVAEHVAEAIDSGKVVALFQGRSEFGPRALGSRSLLADPRKSEMIAFINEDIKLREDFRPFAPSVIFSEAQNWFEDVTPSPYMSITAMVKPEKRAQIPAVCHVDGSARLQTLHRENNPVYFDIIEAFHRRTGVPMVLNTSFNIRAPIVDSPADAVETLLKANGAISFLVLDNHIVELRPFPGSEELDLINPVIQGPFLSEVTSREDGSVNRVRVMQTGGNWITLEETAALEVLEACNGSLTFGEIREELLSEYSEGGDVLNASDIVAALRELYQKRLIRLL